MVEGTAALVADTASTAARHAEKTDTNRVLDPEVVQALVTAGFARHFVPTRWGGADGSVVALLEATALVGQSCTSAAWCGALAAGAARMGAFLPEQGQAELWAEGPDAVVAGALIPVGGAEKVAGGWRLSGEWDFTSGVDFADWALVAGLVRDEGGSRPRFFAVPRGDYQIRDTWFSVGMRGTGSNTLVLDDVFVPEHRAFDRENMLLGRAVGSRAPCHVVPLRAISGILFAAPALGAARGALREWSARMAEKLGPTGIPLREDRSTQLTVARSAGEVDAAELLLRRVAEICDRGAPDPADAVRNPHDCALAVDCLVGAVERLFRTAGSRGQLTAEPLQRFWRDVHCLSSHVALQLEPTGAAYGRYLLGTR
jgi:two-component flavin-dependent monooxygenase